MLKRKPRKFMTITFEDYGQYLRLENLAKSKKMTKNALGKEALRWYLDNHDTILSNNVQAPIAKEINDLKQNMLKAFSRLSYSVAQNIHLTGTILTDALPKEVRGMPESEWKKVWNESKRYGVEYVRRIDEVLLEAKNGNDK